MSKYTGAAPFRLLVLADPQLEGDSSLPNPKDSFLKRLAGYREAITSADTWDDVLLAILGSLRDMLLVDLPRSLRATRKRIDLFGNDFYLAHIYRSLHWWSKPTHVTVLGDLIGSQWVTDGEFERRAWRYWNRVFRGGVRVDDDITITGSEDVHGRDVKVVEDLPLDMQGGDGTTGPWERRIINVAGNHDVGYAGDISDQHTYKFINDVIQRRSKPVEDRSSFTLLLTHLPLHKSEGICIDAPYFRFYDQDDPKPPQEHEPRYKAGGLREQNHLSQHASHSGILQGLFGMSGSPNAPAGGMGRNGLVLTGHDHVGCDVLHFVNRSATPADDPEGAMSPGWSWDATRYARSRSSPSSLSSPLPADTPNIREVTLRSMMGAYGGNAGFLSLWFDSDPSVQEWRYEISTCRFGVQHMWWATHIIAIVTAVLFVVSATLGVWGWMFGQVAAGSNAKGVKGEALASKRADLVKRTQDAKTRTTNSGRRDGPREDLKRNANDK
ncbi:conserved hypothetical protein [Histoplasma mississippiense (nom. inval.)]|uniref:conserved hypothetical protein n=1 Tax=Ajellomyces capsulatus (strain NAm1 / WU24) TaxID=2059318 RepID=UPI000157C183|nr:conserved hypothetical protein [Histoplasma mississippiense (nom. inval.)]EDN08010.1 conserved hypothetical protein [Histoplasma mississippiense (nom. inval.)]